MTDSIYMNINRKLIAPVVLGAFVLGGMVSTVTGNGFYTVKFDNTSADSEVVETTTTTVVEQTEPARAFPEPVAAEPVVEAPVVTEAPKPTPTTAAPKPAADAPTGHKVPAKQNVAPGEPSCDAGYALTPNGCTKVAVPTTVAPQAPKAAPQPINAEPVQAESVSAE